MRGKSEKEQLGVKLQAIKKFLSIDSIEEMNIFLDNFYAAVRIPDDDDEQILESYDEQDATMNDNEIRRKFDLDSVFDSLSRFLAEKDERKKTLGKDEITQSSDS
jgi:hypothetical protein